MVKNEEEEEENNNKISYTLRPSYSTLKYKLKRNSYTYLHERYVLECSQKCYL